eukprot:CAMPEP_0196761976 /NCGR_PEP_ID=MMETSP1095-20130614/1304_1 /TAXON_ID=96789 ORGANISM="Chromulina nebulosa, Strain UTEXLB2642" /NCGR_SAMPLE_ID=MMETSP1095 /ASSEMBLY_ACC=CAM_ASM_000446 /LENGTH=198 /DNA_ID=CAMNT_0042112149 /DNA_START=69 /DNA_END=662 /DNA_ORIENTATION=-
MGPKPNTAKPKSKGKDAKPENGGPLDPKDEANFYRLAYQSLQLQLAERTEEASKAVASKRELQARVEHISKDFEEEKKLTLDITRDMTRQYKSMREELLGRINDLEETVQKLTDIVADSERRQERLLKEKDSIIAMKDQEIADLKAKMDDMADEFGEMLRETLEKMRERIEITSNNFESPELPLQQRLEEIRLNDTHK